MIEPIVLATAYRNLRASAELPHEEFWRAYARIEDAALLCTEPAFHGMVIDALSAYLAEVGRKPALETPPAASHAEREPAQLPDR
jgi:hypothetical protein